MGILDWRLTKSAKAESPSSESVTPPPLRESLPPIAPQPVANIPSRPAAARSQEYLWNLSTPLLQLSQRGDFWTIGDAVAGTHIFGSNSSGKTTGSGQTISKAFLRAGFGGIVLCAKPDEAANWQRYAKAANRDKELIVVNGSNDWRFNFIQYELGRPGDPATRVENLLSTLKTLLEQGGRQQSGDSRDTFWYDASEQLLRNTLMVLTAALPFFNLFDIQQFIDSAPQSTEEAASERWQEKSQCWRYLLDAKAAYQAVGRLADYQVLENYFLVQFARMPDKTRGSITITLAVLLQDLQLGTLRELFATGTNFFPEDTHEGAIIVLDLPTIQNNAHITAQTLFKTVWQQAALRRTDHPNKKTRPIFLWVDEAHFFVTEYDTKFASLARQARACSVYITQNLSSYHQRIGAKKPEAATNAFLGYLQTHIHHAQNDVPTIKHLIDLAGKHHVTRYNESYSKTKGQSYSYGVNQGSSWTRNLSSNGPNSSLTSTHGSSETLGDSASETSGYQTSITVEDRIFADHLTTLPTGSDRQKGISGAIVFRSGQVWSTGTPFLPSRFNRTIP